MVCQLRRVSYLTLPVRFFIDLPGTKGPWRKIHGPSFAYKWLTFRFRFPDFAQPCPRGQELLGDITQLLASLCTSYTCANERGEKLHTIYRLEFVCRKPKFDR